MCPLSDPRRIDIRIHLRAGRRLLGQAAFAERRRGPAFGRMLDGLALLRAFPALLLRTGDGFAWSHDCMRLLQGDRPAYPASPAAACPAGAPEAWSAACAVVVRPAGGAPFPAPVALALQAAARFSSPDPHLLMPLPLR